VLVFGTGISSELQFRDRGPVHNWGRRGRDGKVGYSGRSSMIERFWVQHVGYGGGLELDIDVDLLESKCHVTFPLRTHPTIISTYGIVQYTGCTSISGARILDQEFCL
jgi:hypothetical protein